MTSKRLRLAAIARAEAGNHPAGDENQAGPEIEKYLRLFRGTMNRRASTQEYSDTSRGYGWCCAFAYYCSLEAGFEIDAEPSARVNGSLAAVRTWREWASLPEVGLLLDPGVVPEPGDIVLFDRLLEDRELDHLGIVLGVRSEGLVTAEGNVHNRGGVFSRPMDGHVNSLVRLAGL